MDVAREEFQHVYWTT